MNQDSIRKAIASEAVLAGVIDDPDAMKLIDVGSIKLAADGSPVVPHDFWITTRRTKPHLFKRATGVPIGFDARTASPADYAAAERALIRSAG